LKLCLRAKIQKISKDQQASDSKATAKKSLE
jgi:hypothetical protein